MMLRHSVEQRVYESEDVERWRAYRQKLVEVIERLWVQWELYRTKQQLQRARQRGSSSEALPQVRAFPALVIEDIGGNSSQFEVSASKGTWVTVLRFDDPVWWLVEAPDTAAAGSTPALGWVPRRNIDPSPGIRSLMAADVEDRIKRDGETPTLRLLRSSLAAGLDAVPTAPVKPEEFKTAVDADCPDWLDAMLRRHQGDDADVQHTAMFPSLPSDALFPAPPDEEKGPDSGEAVRPRSDDGGIKEDPWQGTTETKERPVGDQPGGSADFGWNDTDDIHEEGTLIPNGGCVPKDTWSAVKSRRYEEQRKGERDATTAGLGEILHIGKPTQDDGGGRGIKGESIPADGGGRGIKGESVPDDGGGRGSEGASDSPGESEPENRSEEAREATTRAGGCGADTAPLWWQALLNSSSERAVTAPSDTRPGWTSLDDIPFAELYDGEPTARAKAEASLGWSGWSRENGVADQEATPAEAAVDPMSPLVSRKKQPRSYRSVSSEPMAEADAGKPSPLRVGPRAMCASAKEWVASQSPGVRGFTDDESLAALYESLSKMGFLGGNQQNESSPLEVLSAVQQEALGQFIGEATSADHHHAAEPPKEAEGRSGDHHAHDDVGEVDDWAANGHSHDHLGKGHVCEENGHPQHDADIRTGDVREENSGRGSEDLPPFSSIFPDERVPGMHREAATEEADDTSPATGKDASKEQLEVDEQRDVAEGDVSPAGTEGDSRALSQRGLVALVPNPSGRRMKVVKLSGEELFELCAAKLFVAGLARWAGRQRQMGRIRAQLFAWALPHMLKRRQKAKARAVVLFAVGCLRPCLRLFLASKSRSRVWVLGWMRLVLRRREAEKRKERSKQRQQRGVRTKTIRWEALSERRLQGTMWDQRSSQSGSTALPGIVDELSEHSDVDELLDGQRDGDGAGGHSREASLGMSSFSQQLVEAFSAKQAKKMAQSERSARPKKQAKSPGANLLEQNVARNLSIGLAGTVGRRSMEGIATAVRDLDAQAIGGGEAAQSLLDQKMAFTEPVMKKVREYQGPDQDLNLAERFIKYVVLGVPDAKLRLEVMAMEAQFQDIRDNVENRCDRLCDVCDEVEMNRRLKVILRDVILPLGNKLNEGTRQEDAKGIRLTSLNALVQTRAVTGETFLRFVVEGLLSRAKSLLEVVDEFPTLMATPRALFSFTPIDSDAVQARNGLKLMEKLQRKIDAETVEEDPSDQPHPRELERLSELIEEAQNTKEIVDQQVTQAHERYKRLARFVGEDAAEIPPEELFPHVQEFVQLLTKEIRSALSRKERRQRAEAKEAKKARRARSAKAPASRDGAAVASDSEAAVTTPATTTPISSPETATPAASEAEAVSPATFTSDRHCVRADTAYTESAAEEEEEEEEEDHGETEAGDEVMPLPTRENESGGPSDSFTGRDRSLSSDQRPRPAPTPPSAPPPRKSRHAPSNSLPTDLASIPTRTRRSISNPVAPQTRHRRRQSLLPESFFQQKSTDDAERWEEPMSAAEEASEAASLREAIEGSIRRRTSSAAAEKGAPVARRSRRSFSVIL